VVRHTYFKTVNKSKLMVIKGRWKYSRSKNHLSRLALSIVVMARQEARLKRV
jgi:hypothetical protein